MYNYIYVIYVQSDVECRSLHQSNFTPGVKGTVFLSVSDMAPPNWLELTLKEAKKMPNPDKLTECKQGR